MVLASLTYAVAALRMSTPRRARAAAQRGRVARVRDVICTDKTGTLTEASLSVVERCPRPAWRRPSSRSRSASYAASSPARNGTLEAIAASYPASRRRSKAEVPFSSRRRWSGAAAGRAHAIVLGAPELFAARAARRARGGRAAQPGGACSPSRAARRLEGGESPRLPRELRRSASWCSPSGCGPRRARPSSTSAPRASSSRFCPATRRQRSRRSQRTPASR